MINPNNGESKNFDLEGLGTGEVLTILVETVRQLAEQLELIQEIQVDILEKVNNLTLEDSGFSIED